MVCLDFFEDKYGSVFRSDIVAVFRYAERFGNVCWGNGRHFIISNSLKKKAKDTKISTSRKNSILLTTYTINFFVAFSSLFVSIIRKIPPFAAAAFVCGVSILLQCRIYATYLSIFPPKHHQSTSVDCCFISSPILPAKLRRGEKHPLLNYYSIFVNYEGFFF